MTTDEEILAEYAGTGAKSPEGQRWKWVSLLDIMKLAREDSRKCKSCGVSLGDTCDKCDE